VSAIQVLTSGKNLAVGVLFAPKTLIWESLSLSEAEPEEIDG
jgi:hypothetical protein